MIQNPLDAEGFIIIQKHEQVESETHKKKIHDGAVINLEMYFNLSYHNAAEITILRYFLLTNLRYLSLI